MLRFLTLPLLAGLVFWTSAVSAEVGRAKWVRSPRAKYKVQRAGDSVVIVAYGTFPTSGYKAKLRQLPIEPFPPQFEFVELKPDGITLQVITPFATIASFKAPNPVKSVLIHDANGKHIVMVERPAKSIEAGR